jgi:hypothetical protein
MKRELAVTCLVSALAACGPKVDQPSARVTRAGASAATTVPQYALTVSFDGLIAFVQQGNSVWALFVKADYNKYAAINQKEVPPCAVQEVGAQKVPFHFPPHVAALRILSADVDLSDLSTGNVVSVGGVAPLFFIDGLDLTFDTGKKAPSIDLAKPSLVSRNVFASVLNDKPDKFKQHDTIKKDYLDTFAKAQAAGYLSARALINFGDTVKTEACPGPTQYGVKTKVGDACGGNAMSLAESVKVAQQGLTSPITITLDAKRQLIVRPHGGGNQLVVEVLNIPVEALADFHLDRCADPHPHPGAYRWFYYLLDNAPDNKCAMHYFPCDTNGATNGTKCPQPQMQLP